MFGIKKIIVNTDNVELKYIYNDKIFIKNIQLGKRKENASDEKIIIDEINANIVYSDKNTSDLVNDVIINKYPYITDIILSWNMRYLKVECEGVNIYYSKYLEENSVIYLDNTGTEINSTSKLNIIFNHNNDEFCVTVLGFHLVNCYGIKFKKN